MKKPNSLYEIFNLIDKGIYKKDDIITSLNIKAPTFYKNIQKLKASGFKVKKNNNIYFFENYRRVLSLEACEKSIIAYMLYVAYKNLPKYKCNNFFNFIKKFLLLSSESDYNEIIDKFQLIKKHFLIDEYEEKINKLEFLITKKQNVKITLRSNRIFLIKPLKFNIVNEKLFLYFMDINKNTDDKINIENIVNIEKCDSLNTVIPKNEIIFELYGALAKRYLLKKDERIVKKKKESIIIAFYGEDKDSLFQRLLRYDTSCKILFPKTEVNAFNNLINRAIINIDIFKDKDE